MKPILTVFLVLLSVMAFCQCHPYFAIKEGVKSTYDFYNAKDKLASRSINEFKNVSDTGGKLSATMLMQIIDPKKGDVLTSSESEWTCEGGVVRFSMDAINISGTDMSAAGMDVTVEGDEMDIPSDLKPGQTLNDVSYHITMKLSGINVMDRNFFIKNRKVEKEESITTPAGTFNCIKISYTTESSGKSGGMSKPMLTSIWYSKDVGMVKVENYNDDKVSNSQILTKLEK
jgi:hypothetical protein